MSALPNTLLEPLQAEVDTAFLYAELARHHAHTPLQSIFHQLSLIEQGHAQKILEKIRLSYPDAVLPAPSLLARFRARVASWMGYDFILSYLATTENQIANTVVRKKQAAGEKITGLENLHFSILQALSERQEISLQGGLLSQFEGKHQRIGGNELRAAVLGANDGLVSNLALVMGISAAVESPVTILITGIAGLLAGAISMALGEWLSVQSSVELYQKQVMIEAEELETHPEEELSELTLLYQAKGLSAEQAHQLAKEVFAYPETALDTLVKEELGFDKKILHNSALKAAVISFCLFSIGAIIPLLPFFLKPLFPYAISCSLSLSAIALFTLGASITLFTGRHPLYAGLRQTLIGLTAAAITFFTGKILGKYFS